MASQGQGRVAKTLPTCYVNAKEIGLREHGFGSSAMIPSVCSFVGWLRATGCHHLQGTREPCVLARTSISEKPILTLKMELADSVEGSRFLTDVGVCVPNCAAMR